MQQSQFDGSSGCKTCDRANVSNAVHALLQLRSCEINDIDTLEDAIILVEDEARDLLAD
jgi:hypothetical protein